MYRHWRREPRFNDRREYEPDRDGPALSYSEREAVRSNRRVNVRGILANPAQRRDLMVSTIVATQAREGVETTREQAEAAYDAVQLELFRQPLTDKE